MQSETLRNDEEEDVDEDDDQLLRVDLEQPTPKAKEQSGVMEA